MRAQGASVRNFGLITVTGQGPTSVWPLARRTREVWAEVAALAVSQCRVRCGERTGSIPTAGPPLRRTRPWLPSGTSGAATPQRSIAAAVPVPIKAVQCGSGRAGRPSTRITISGLPAEIVNLTRLPSALTPSYTAAVRCWLGAGDAFSASADFSAASAAIVESTSTVIVRMIVHPHSG
jgi:hypothetical protein